jgi:hypothetical protein
MRQHGRTRQRILPTELIGTHHPHTKNPAEAGFLRYVHVAKLKGGDLLGRICETVTLTLPYAVNRTVRHDNEKVSNLSDRSDSIRRSR